MPGFSGSNSRARINDARASSSRHGLPWGFNITPRLGRCARGQLVCPIPHRLHTDLPIEECRRRLSELRAGPRLIEAMPDQSGDRGVFGQVRGDRFWLYARHIMVVNHFRRLFYGSLQATSNGTLVEGVFRTPRWVGTIAVVIEIFMAFGLFLSLLGAGDRTYKLGSGTTSEYGRYVKSLGEPRGGPCWAASAPRPP